MGRVCGCAHRGRLLLDLDEHGRARDQRRGQHADAAGDPVHVQRRRPAAGVQRSVHDVEAEEA